MREIKAFCSYNPFVLLLFYASVLAVSVFTQNPLTIGISFLSAVLFLCCTMQIKKVIKEISVLLPFSVIVALTNPIFSHNGVTPLFYINSNAVTKESIFYGFYLGLVILTVIIWCKSMMLVVTSEKYTYIFAKTLPKLSLVLSMCLKFIPIYKKRFEEAYKVQKTLGKFSSESRFERIKNMLYVFFSVLAYSAEKAMETAQSMKSKGCELQPKTNFTLYYCSKRDIILGIIIIFTLAMYIVSSVGNEFYYFPSISVIPKSIMCIIGYFMFAILSLLPTIIEIREAFLWRYYIRKI